MTDDLHSLRSLVGEEVDRFVQEQQELEAELAESRRSEEKLQAFANEMAVLNQVFVLGADASTVDELLVQVVDTLLELLDLDLGRAYVLARPSASRPAKVELRYTQENPVPESLDEIPSEVDQAPWSFVFREGLPIVSAQFPELLPMRDPEVSTKRPGRGAYRVAALVPIMAGFKVIGALTFACRHRKAWADAEINTMQAIGQQVGTLIAKMRTDEERRRLVGELSSRNAELERFTYTVSHELKNPLVTIKGFLGMMEQDLEKEQYDGLTRHLGKIGSAADTLIELLDGLREVSKVGRACHTSEVVDLDELAREALILLEGPLAEQCMRPVLSDSLPMVFGDRVRLLQVMTNLVDNAIKFQDDTGGLLEIGAEWREGAPVCFVRDSGIGIEGPYLERIFGLFEQLDPTCSGNGVGLALAGRIVEHHGGRIWAESPGLGFGSTFYFVLPEMASLTG